MLPPTSAVRPHLLFALLVCPLLGCATTTSTRAAPAAGSPPPTSSGVELPSLAGAGQPTAVVALAASTPAFQSLEGPYWVASGGYLLFSDVVEANGPGAKIYRFDPTARQFSVVAYPSPTPTSTNGLAMDGHGALLACERHNGRVVRIDGAHGLVVLADHAPASQATPATASATLDAPNDLAVRADGNIYFTDRDWGARAGVSHAPMGVYRIDRAGKVSRILDTVKPNGIALSPDGAFLYVGSDTQGKVWRLPLDAQGNAGMSTLFIDGAHVPGGFAVPDGICVDDAGDLYVTNNDDAIKAIIVFDSGGRPKGKLQLPERPSNCTFGGVDRKTLYVTTLHAIYEIPMPTPGLP
jgi:gluconolactonase